MVGGYQIWGIRAGRPRRLRVLLTGGVHGDEPAGVEAVLGFVEEDMSPWLEQVEFTVVPWVNPVGYVRDTRDNGDGADINRSFENGECARGRTGQEGAGGVSGGRFRRLPRGLGSRRLLHVRGPAPGLGGGSGGHCRSGKAGFHRSGQRRGTASLCRGGSTRFPGPGDW